MTGGAVPKALMKAPYGELLSEFSPDGRWIAYVSNESGAFQVYVRSYPELAGPWRVSSEGGMHPKWAPGGRALYYLTPGAIMTAEIDTDGTSISSGPARVLIRTEVRLDHLPGGAPYDVAPDGRILVNASIAAPSAGGESQAPPRITVILNRDARP